MKNMNSNAAENKLHKYPLPVKLEEMNRMPGQEERGRRTRSSKVFLSAEASIRRSCIQNPFTS